MSKGQLRQYYKNVISQISFDQQLRISTKINNILYMRYHNTPKIILSFCKMADQNEIDLYPLNQVLARKKQLALPRVNPETNKLECYLVEDLRTLKPQPPFQIYEPDPERHIQIPLPNLNVILTPGLAFDTHFQRLGRGKGYYDRLIKECRLHSGSPDDIEVIGVGHLVQLSSDQLPTKSYDQSMDELLLL